MLTNIEYFTKPRPAEPVKNGNVAIVFRGTASFQSISVASGPDNSSVLGSGIRCNQDNYYQ